MFFLIQNSIKVVLLHCNFLNLALIASICDLSGWVYHIYTCLSTLKHFLLNLILKGQIYRLWGIPNWVLWLASFSRFQVIRFLWWMNHISDLWYPSPLPFVMINKFYLRIKINLLYNIHPDFIKAAKWVWISSRILNSQLTCQTKMKDCLWILN